VVAIARVRRDTRSRWTVYLAGAAALVIVGVAASRGC
jgi:hypothetical protein